MIVPVNVKGHSCLALGIPRINTYADVKELRNALLDIIDTCISDEEMKDVTASRTFSVLLNVACELTRDLEDKERGERR